MSESQLLDSLVYIRPTKNHFNFILSHWLKGHSEGYARIDKISGYYPAHKVVIEHLLTNASSLIAVLKENHDVALGYLCYEDTHIPTIHFGYTKPRYRRQGIYTALVGAALPGISHRMYTHLPKGWQRRYSMDHEHIYHPYSPLYRTLSSLIQEPITIDPTLPLTVTHRR